MHPLVKAAGLLSWAGETRYLSTALTHTGPPDPVLGCFQTLGKRRPSFEPGSDRKGFPVERSEKGPAANVPMRRYFKTKNNGPDDGGGIHRASMAGGANIIS